MSDIDDICVISHPLGSASESHAKTLLKIISEITSVSLIALDIPNDSLLWEEYDAVSIAGENSTDNVLSAAIHFLANQLRIARTVRNRPETTVLFFGVTAYLIPILIAKIIGKKVVLQPRGDVPLTLRLQWEQQLPTVIAKLLAGCVALLEAIGYHVSDAIIAYTPSMADELGLNKYENKLYPNGARYVDLDRFYPSQPFPERECVVGFLGRLDEEKGIETLATVARQLPSDVKFRFIGDGSRRDWLESELADEISIGDVDVTGWVDHEDVPTELNKLRLLVMPSEPTEGLPTTILEAMACGTPVYATPVSGVPSVIEEEVTGFLITETTPEQIATDIESILTRDDIGVISDNARELIENEYSFDAAVSRYRSILTSISKT